MKKVGAASTDLHLKGKLQVSDEKKGAGVQHKHRFR